MMNEMKGWVNKEEPGRRAFACTECGEWALEEPWPRRGPDNPQECWWCGSEDILGDDDDDEQKADGIQS
jgi:hypothetical protein